MNDALTKLLRFKWLKPDAGDFDDVFSDRERAVDPSYYIYRPGEDRNEICPFTYDELKALAQAGVLGDGWYRDENGAISVNEHVQHALLIFLGEGSKAWKDYENRRDQAIQACRHQIPPPWSPSPEQQKKITYKGQVYTLIGEQPYTTRDGRETTLEQWESPCAECGTPFVVARPKGSSAWVLTRRCPKHARKGQHIKPSTPLNVEEHIEGH
jgi:hypothetical protein